MQPFIDLGAEYLSFLWASFSLLAPMLLLGLLLAGLIHVLISRQAVLRWLRRDSLGAVTTSAAIGVPIPLCSCSVVPVVAEMRRKGASRSSCMSLLITAPETGADSILVTYAFFGPVMAVIRPVISFITGVAAGLCCIGWLRDDDGVPKSGDECCDHHRDHGAGHVPLFPGNHDCHVTPAYLKHVFATAWQRLASRLNARWKASQAESPPEGPSLGAIAGHIWRYGFIEIADDILFSLLVGIAIGGLLFLALPADLMEHEYARWISYPVMVLFSLPLYICASASTPIAAALIAKGFSPGAALIFLMTGPATNTGTIAVILSQFGARFTAIYVGAVIALTVAFGIAFDLLLLAVGFEIAAHLGTAESPGLAVLQWGGALALAALIVWRFRAGALKSGYEDLISNLRPPKA